MPATQVVTNSVSFILTAPRPGDPAPLDLATMIKLGTLPQDARINSLSVSVSSDFKDGSGNWPDVKVSHQDTANTLTVLIVSSDPNKTSHGFNGMFARGDWAAQLHNGSIPNHLKDTPMSITLAVSWTGTVDVPPPPPPVDTTGTWTGTDLSTLTNAPLATPGTLSGFRWSQHKQIVFRGSNGDIYELAASHVQPWTLNNISALAQAPAASTSRLAGFAWKDFKQVAFIGTNGHIHELAVTGGQPWSVNDLSQIAGAPDAALGAIDAYVWGDHKQVVYLDAAGNVHELVVGPGEQWHHVNLSAIANAPPAAPGAIAGYSWNGYKQVVYLDAAGNVHELVVGSGEQWHHANLSAIANAPPAAPGAIAGYSWNEYKQVVYIGTDGHIHELVVGPGEAWRHNDLSSVVANVPNAQAGAIAGYRWNAYKQVAYVGVDGHVHELIVGSGAWGAWEHNDLSQLAVGVGGGAALAGDLVAFTWGVTKVTKQIFSLTAGKHVFERVRDIP